MASSQDTEDGLRRTILDSARSVVVEEGYSGLTMRRLARKIGYSPTSIYLHFESKDALLHTLIEEGMNVLNDRLTEAARSKSPEESVRSVCEAYVAFGLENPEYYEIMFMLHPQHMERFPPDKYRRARQNLDVIGRAIQSTRDSNSDRGEPLLLEATAVWTNLHGAVSLMIAQRLDVSLDRNRFISSIVDRTLRGLGLNFGQEAEG